MKNLILFLCLFLATEVIAQTPVDTTKKAPADTVIPNWKRGGVVGFNFTQASFTNWAAGGINSISGQFLFNCFVNYKKGLTTWDNNLDVSYGLMQQGTAASLRKADDKIDYTSKYGQYAFKKVWYYSVLANFKTQFQPGYTYQGDTSKTLISDFMSPGYLVVAVGLDYKPTDKFSIFTAPFTAKYTFVTNQTLANAGAYGVDKAIVDTAGNVLLPGKNIRQEFGGYFRMQYRGEIMKGVNMNAKLELFSNYLDRPQNIDVNAEILLTLKVNKYIAVNLNIQAIYDNDVNIAVDNNKDGVIDGEGPRLQFRQVLGVGFAAKF
ncbi:MAG TPA: DUF3078 domain-containing protein [Bacteroidia bacterium]|nr:DUF3078 domain-containing protein [Bacteroidia bacterium]